MALQHCALAKAPNAERRRQQVEEQKNDKQSKQTQRSNSCGTHLTRNYRQDLNSPKNSYRRIASTLRKNHSPPVVIVRSSKNVTFLIRVPTDDFLYLDCSARSSPIGRIWLHSGLGEIIHLWVSSRSTLAISPTFDVAKASINRHFLAIGISSPIRSTGFVRWLVCLDRFAVIVFFFSSGRSHHHR